MIYGRLDTVSQTITTTRIGVTTTESTQNAAIHGPHDRSTLKGVTTQEAANNAVANTATAGE